MSAEPDTAAIRASYADHVCGGGCLGDIEDLCNTVDEARARVAAVEAALLQARTELRTWVSRDSAAIRKIGAALAAAAPPREDARPKPTTPVSDARSWGGSLTTFAPAASPVPPPKDER